MHLPESLHQFAPWLSAGGLRQVYEGVAVHRGRAYAESGCVRGLQVVEVDPACVAVSAEVWGSAPAPYEVEVTVELDDELLMVDSDCECPVGYQCKHGAAALLRLGDVLGDVRRRTAVGMPDGPGRDAWSQALDGALRELDAARGPADAVPLALQLDLVEPVVDHWRGAGVHPPTGAELRARPMRTGARGGWVRSGAAWRDVRRGGHLGGHHDPQQWEALVALREAVAAGAQSTYSHYFQPPDHPALGDLGAQLWPLLRHAVEAGVVLLPGAGLTGVTLVDEPLTVTGDAVRTVEGAVLSVGVDHAGRRWVGEGVLLIGHQPHGVALLDRATGTAVLAPLAAALPAGLADLVRRGTTAVPDAHVDTFLSQQLPRLVRHLPIGSADGSLTVPDPPAPRLRLRVTWDRTPSAELVWEWRYRLGEGEDAAERACAVGATDPLDGLRDVHAERAELHRLVAAGALTGEPRARAVPPTEVLALAEQELPRLREAGIEVEERERPDFRPASGPVEISFVAAEEVGEPGAETTDDWLDLTVMVTVDGERVPLPTVLEALTRGQDRIVLPSGLHVSTDAPELAHLRELVAAAAELRETRGDRVSLGRHDLGLWARVGDLADVDVLPAQAQEWVRRARALRDLDTLPDPDPVGVASTLRPYQREGFRWLSFLHDHGLGGILADDMGLGKTLQVLALVAHARAAGAGPFLVVAPTSVVANWAAEAARHTPDLRVRTVTASLARLGTALPEVAGEADVVVTTYTLLRLDAEEYAAVSWGGLVLDEAQHVKNHLSKTHQAVRRVDAPFTLAVTGTPFENRLLELWSLLALVAPGLYPTAKAFTDHVVRPVEKGGDAAAMQRFRQRLRPFVLRRTKDLVARDLPPKQEQVLEVSLGARHRKIYDAHLARERQRILGLVDDFDRNRVAILAALTTLRQASLDPALVDPEHDRVGSAKIDALVDHLLELAAEGHRALVFSQFTGFLRRVRDRLDAEGVSYSYLDGRTRKRAEAIDRFRDGHVPAFLISLKAGGVGLTLTEADYVFVLDPWWNPAVEAQAVDRAHRIGQTRPVLVYRMVASGTIEEKVMALKARKAALFSEVMDGDGALGAIVDAADVRALLA